MRFTEAVPSSFIPSYAKGLPILVVDHDTTSLACVASLLEQCTFNVTTAELASDALSMIREEKKRFKLLIADMNMTDMDSLEFLRKVVRKGIPVVAITSERSANAIGKALAGGASLCLDKPITSEDLKYVWQYAFTRKRRSGSQLTQNINEKKNKKNQGKESPKGIVIKEGDSPDQCATPRTSKCKGKEVQDLNVDDHTPMMIDPKGKGKPLDDGDVNVIEDDGSKGGWTTRPSLDKGCTSKENQSRTYSDRQTFTRHGEIINGGTQSSNNSGNNAFGKRKRSPTVHWTPEIHRKFLASISEVCNKKAGGRGFQGVRPYPPQTSQCRNLVHEERPFCMEEAWPNTILEKIKERCLSLRHLSYHLQKYRKQLSEVTGAAELPFMTRSTPYQGPNYRFVEAVAKANKAFRLARLRARFNTGGNKFQASQTTTNVLTPDTGAVNSSQKMDKIVLVHPGTLQKPHYAAGRYNSGNVPEPTGYTGGSQLLDNARFLNSDSGTRHRTINVPGNSTGRRYQELNAMQIGNSAPANLHKANNGLPVVNKGWQEPGAMPLSDHLSNLLNLTPPHSEFSDLMSLLLEKPANFTDKSQNEFNSQIQEKNVIELSDSLSNLINPNQPSTAGADSVNLPNERGTSFKGMDMLPMELGHKNQEPNALKFPDPLPKLFDQDLPQPKHHEMLNKLEGEPMMIKDSKGPSDIMYQNQGLPTTGAAKNSSAGFLDFDQDLFDNSDLVEILHGPMDFKDNLPLDLTNMNQKMDAAANSNTSTTSFDDSHQGQQDCAHLSNILEDEPIGFLGLPGEPNPEDINHYCHWFTNFSIAGSP